MVRLVFRPYTQVGRPICTSGPLRASTRVSSGFALPRHSSPSFGSYRTRSRSTSPTGRTRRAGGAPGKAHGGGRDPTSAGARRPSLSLRHGVSRASPLTRACVRLLGPCFKTGRVGSRHRRRPLAPQTWAGPRPGATRRGRGALRTVRPGRTVAPGAGGPVPGPAPRSARERASGGRRRTREGAASTLVHGPGKRRKRCGRRGAVKLAAGAASHLRPRALPSRPGAGRDAPPRRKCARPGPASRAGGGVPRGDPPEPPGGRPISCRVESPGRTARAPPVYLSTVSRPLELSLQSSFQLSLKVLVCYRSRAGI